VAEDNGSTLLKEKLLDFMADPDLVLEAYANGVSTRKIDHLTRAMGIENISASQVSEITKEPDSQEWTGCLHGSHGGHRCEHGWYA